ncbi:MAG: hypothetical protein HZA50_14165 [Planctomycetes bacterium]|nr:hypothetical protein [Planctomycetota bacterium]
MTTQPPPSPMQPVFMPNDAGKRRPVGLTALACANFALAGLAIVLAIFLILWANLTDWSGDLYRQAAGGGDADPSMPASPAETKVVASRSNNMEKAAVSAAMIAPAVLLLVISGFGYLRQSRGMGYMAGMIYGGLGVLGGVYAAATSGLSIVVFIALAYPVLTVVLLNTSFRTCWK